MVSEAEIREHLIQFLLRQIDLDAFEDWFAQKTWDIHLHSDFAAQKIAFGVELRLAEYSSGHMSDEEFRSELIPFVSEYSITLSPNVQSGSSITIIPIPWSILSADIRPAVVNV